MNIDPNTVDGNNISHSQFTTYSYETDSFYQARLAFYFEMIQEAAGHHAACKGCSIPDLNREGKTWVITRSSVVVHRYTVWPETISVETWAQEPIRLHLPRIVRGFDEAGNPVFTATTYWAVLDMEKGGRPCRPATMVERIGLVPKERFLDVNLGLRKTYDESGCVTLSKTEPEIKYLDSDSNRHVNNISYLNWALETLPDAFRDRLKVSKIDVSWIRQTFSGDKITVYTGSLDAKALEADNPVLFHKIERTEQDGSKTIVWEGISSWEPRKEISSEEHLAQ
jgi:acyl-ACP thioesterase